ncbi:IS21-like element helper ATPase IstB [Thauera sinica]|uniref:IS21-like element helper ATPase IstB n=1 Tax=Thauera sinica TaxID=2665146 RepID=A0ABW1AV98_9RHOO|nr:IS21-like element helper ATPase IstB [Thauera sp. K11]ATE62872.1 AAA family ATPase [Thauera sp. K11]
MSGVHQTISRLRELRLTSMAEAYSVQLQQPKLHQLSFDDRFGLLVEHEASERDSKKLKRLVRSAGFPESASLEDADYRASRDIDKGFIASLASCEWIRQQLNLIVLGATGVGKTWLACAFGSQACRQRLPATFFRASDLYQEIAVASHDGSLPKLKAGLIKPSLLIIDDFGLSEISSQAAQVLLDVVDRRMRTGSLLITSQFTTDQWHGFFPDPTLADAILDRVVHQAHRITLKGESMRKLQAKRKMPPA